MTKLKTTLAVAVIVALVAASCGDRGAPAGGSGQAPSAAADGKDVGARAAVTSIVFVGQKDACACDRERIDKGWQVLQQVLAQGKNVAVKRLQIDVDEAEADTYDDMKSLMVLPGFYFLDDKGGLVELLQGEVDARKISEVLR